jgi:hypothetical protein
VKRIIPEKVSGYRQEVINGLIDCIIALWPMESATIISNVTSRGTDHEIKRIQAGGGAIVFSGTAYIAGRKITGLSSDSAKPWVRCFLDTATAEEHAGPPPDPFPSNEEWYEKAQTAGNIHIPRA